MKPFLIACCSLAALSLVACGGGGGGSGNSSCTPGTTASMSITASGLSPKAVCLLPGGTVTFDNTDAAAHDIESDGSCPALSLGSIAAGQKKSVALPDVQTCSIHDADNPTNAAFQGTVAVSSATTSGGGS